MKFSMMRLRLAIAAIFLGSTVAIVKETRMTEQYSIASLSMGVNTAALPVVSSTPAVSAFDMAIEKSYNVTFAKVPSIRRQKFDVETWDKRTTGGLTNRDRTLLAEIYGEANSVFEYGLGESTNIGNHMGVTRYAGIDSDAVWAVATHFRFYFADIGENKILGISQRKVA
jgi:hypothetical protein